MEGNVSGYVCNHGSPNGERDTASPRLWTMLRTQASDEEADDVFARRHLYCGTPVVTSWAVAGQQVVFFSYVSSDRVTLRAFPVATPRGRSVSFPIRGTMVTYVTWDDYDKMAINTRRRACSTSFQPSFKAIKARTGRFEYNCMHCIKANKRDIKLSQVSKLITRKIKKK